MELNLNCDLGEKSKHFDGKNDPKLLKIINTANIACGYHAGNKKIIEETIKISKKNNVSIGAHPSFKDKKNFGRKRLNLTNNEIYKIVTEQLKIISKIADKLKYPITHVKPHGALNNIACEDIDVSMNIAKAIKEFDKNLIFMVLPLTCMDKAAKKVNIKYACEIFADRNYNDYGLLIDRSNQNSLINNPKEIIKNIIIMLENKSIKSISGKLLKTDIDSICVHGDGYNAVKIAKKIKEGLIKKQINLLPLNKLSKFM